MCGRYTLLAEEAEIKRAFQIGHALEGYQPSYNIAPTQNVLAVIHDGQERRAGYLRWGLVPSWAKDAKRAARMINARSETAHQKPSFKQLMARKRCLIIADSFYEWRPDDKAKEPERIQLASKRLFAFAGLWDQWKDGDRVLYTCTMLTKAANPFMEAIHHRMPIILSKEDEAAWLNPQLTEAETAHDFLTSLDTEPLTSYQVSSYVNKPDHNDRRCIKRLIT